MPVHFHTPVPSCSKHCLRNYILQLSSLSFAVLDPMYHLIYRYSHSSRVLRPLPAVVPGVLSGAYHGGAYSVPH